MYEAEILEVRRYHDLKNMEDEEILPFVESAVDELAGIAITEGREIKAVAYMTLKLLGHKFWLKIQQRANEYDETVETFKDVREWEAYWQNRLDTIIVPSQSMSGIYYGAV